MTAHYASYEGIAKRLHETCCGDSKGELSELFSLMVFNVLCGNTDDHARNHAVFWDGKNISLTPAYDICPQLRSGSETTHAMSISGTNNLSQLKTCLDAAKSFMLTDDEALAIFDHQINVIETCWDAVCDQAEISIVTRNAIKGRQFLNSWSLITGKEPSPAIARCRWEPGM